jgi:4'-phosphopantetheinyl transferase
VGVDIEQIREDFATEEIAGAFLLAGRGRRHSGPSCCGAVVRRSSIAGPGRRLTVKARGEGLSLPLHRFEVSVAPGDPAALLASADDTREPSRWSLRELAPGAGYAAALAVDGHGWRPLCWRGPEP